VRRLRYFFYLISIYCIPGTVFLEQIEMPEKPRETLEGKAERNCGKNAGSHGGAYITTKKPRQVQLILDQIPEDARTGGS
jgi:hypothetical protein